MQNVGCRFLKGRVFMEEPLNKYRDKRDPALTNEPFSAERKLRSEGHTWAGRFVIHQHDASRMHFDVRLQVGNTLQSFAVPRGISLDPKDKHLAIHTEDHPLEYLLFEDVIPEGNYGAGSMIVWDTGGVTYLETSAEDGIERGKIDFVLHGLKAKGRFAFIATGRRRADTGLAGTKNAAQEWLLIKKSDAHSKEGDAAHLAETMPRSVLSGLSVKELPQKAQLGEQLEDAAARLAEKYPPRGATEKKEAAIVPMVCATEGAPQSSPDFLYELKLDGVRIIAEKNSEDVRLTYRSGRITTRNYADVARSVSKLIVERVVLDGEIVAFDEAGRPTFGRLAPRIMSRNQKDILRAEAEVPVVYMVFDVLEIGEHNLRAAPIEERKALLTRLLPALGLARPLDHIVARGDALFQLCEAQGLEGMVAKRRGSPYLPGPKVSGHWVKIKREEDAEFVVVGYTLGKTNEGTLGALGLGSYVGDRLVYRGRVGSGLTNKQRSGLLESLKAIQTEEFSTEVPEEANLIPVAVQMVVRVKSHGFTEDGHLRAAVFQGVRADVRPRDCTAGPNDELAIDLPVFGGGIGSTDERDAGRLVVITNREKIYFPEDQFNKGDLLDYYEAIAPVMLPYLARRPVVLVRYPDGIHGKSFYQWRAPEGTPDWVRTFELYDDEKQAERGAGKAAFLIDSTDALLHIVNLGCIPIHVLAGRENTREHCDFITIDFDIAQRPFKDAVVMALSLMEILEDLSLTGFPKTSGQRGLHVLVPMGPGVPFEGAKILCELLGRVLVGRHSDISTMERRIEKRGEKLYVDTGQTGRSRTIVAPYSVRAIQGARVSTPLSWGELHLALDPSAFSILTVPDRVATAGDPMREIFEVRPNLPRVLHELSRWAGALT